MNNLRGEELRRIASHEAGHAIVAVHLDVPFDYVDVQTDGTGGVHLPSDIDAAESTFPALAQKQVVVAHAGAAAQRMLHPDQNEREILQCASDDRAKIRNIVGDFSEIKSEKARTEAESLVRELRDVIQETANALLNKPTLTLTREEVRKIYTAKRNS